MGAGSILIQSDDFGFERSISFFSKIFTLCQKNYTVIEKEALALVGGL